jgi:hypothetical protein
MSRRTVTKQAVAERRAAALRMRREGKTYAEVAEALAYSGATSASKDVHRALRAAVMEQGRALLDLERERLDALQAILWPLAEKGDVRAARELVRLMERRARMLGIDLVAQAAHHTEGQENTKSLLGDLMDAMQAAHALLPDQ